MKKKLVWESTLIGLWPKIRISQCDRHSGSHSVARANESRGHENILKLQQQTAIFGEVFRENVRAEKANAFNSRNKFSLFRMGKNYSIKFNAIACGMCLCTYAQLLPHFLLAILLSFNAITSVEISRMRWTQLIRLFPISEDLKIVLLISILRCWCKKARERIESYTQNPMFLFVLSIYEFEYIYLHLPQKNSGWWWRWRNGYVCLLCIHSTIHPYSIWIEFECM